MWKLDWSDHNSSHWFNTVYVKSWINKADDEIHHVKQEKEKKKDYLGGVEE